MTESTQDSLATSPQPSSKSAGSSEPTDQAASALKSSVVADAHELTDQAKHGASDVITHARKSAEAQISGGKDRVADRLGSVAEAIRNTGEHLGDDTGLTEYVARAADQVEAASEYLKDRSLGDVLGDVGGFARREPAMFLGGAFVLGLIGGRFLKSSHPQPAASAPSSYQGYSGQRSNARTSGRSGAPLGAGRNPAASGAKRGPSGTLGGLAKPAPGPSSSERTRSPGLGASPSESSHSNGGAEKTPGAV